MMSSSADRKRIEQILEQARNLPRIEVPSETWAPTESELKILYARLAMAYATSTALLTEAIPIIVEKLFPPAPPKVPRAKHLRRVR
jgi:hypothetical protein